MAGCHSVDTGGADMKKSFLVLVMAVMLLSCACSQKELYEGSVVSVAGDGLVKPELVREYSKQFYQYNSIWYNNGC